MAEKMQAYIAFDLGAESGRAMLVTYDGEKVHMQEVHRFENLPQQLPSGLHWNLLELWANLVRGLKAAGEVARRDNLELVSLGVDTWGVDFGLIGKSGQLLGLPYAYRDERHPPAMEAAFEKVGAERIYDATGIQFLPFNTLYQLIAQQQAEPQTLEAAEHLLNTPDLLHYFFTGKAVSEATIASTTQMVDPRTGKWNLDLLKELGLPAQMLGEIVPAGTVVGKLRDEIAKEAQVEPIDVVAPGGHDTASAVAAVPVDMAADKKWAYLSSGTWSLMGAELDEPVVSEQTREVGFTNERGVGDKIRFLKNISGLWLVQETRRDLERQGQSYDYAQLTQLAEESEPFRTLVDPDYAPFATPGDMLSKLAEFAKKTDQPAPETAGQAVRCCLESLALTYRRTLAGMQELLGCEFELLHLVGGGGKNQLLNQMTADALGMTVIVGPYEGTAIGNALTQAIGKGHVEDLAHLRRIVRASFELKTVEPRDPQAFIAQIERFKQIAV